MLSRLGALGTLVAAPFLTLGVSAIALADMKWRHASPSAVQRYPSWWGRVICRGCGVRVEVRGREHLPVGQPCILAANHTSQFDIFALQGYLDYDFRWLAKKELFRWPIFGTALELSGSIPVDRGKTREAAKSLTAAARRISAGTSVVIFPEGTRSPDGRLRPFKAGAMVLAIKAGVPIVPVGISGSHQVLPKGAWLPRAGRIVITIGEPVPTTGLTTKDKAALAETVQEQVAALIEAGRS